MDEGERTPHPLAALRIVLGLSRVEFAEAVHDAARRRGLRSGIDKHRVRKWEVNGVRPDAVSQTYIAEVLGIPPWDVDPAAWPAWLPRVDQGVVPLGHANTVPALREALHTMDRRTLLSAIPGSALVLLAGSWAGTEPTALAAGPPRPGAAVGEDVVSLLEETSARLNTLATEQRQHIAPLYDAHLARVTDLIDERRYARPLGARLHKLAASLSQTVAWIRFDHGQHGAASRYWIAGLHNAHAGNDRDMGAALLGDLAYQASWRNDPTTAAGILTKALSRTTHPAASSLLHLRLARAQAALGERRATQNSLNAAERLLGAGDNADIPAWCSWMSPADLAVDAGRCLLDLGDTTRHTVSSPKARRSCRPVVTRPAESSSRTGRRATSAVANPKPQLPTPSKLSTWPNGSEPHGASSSSAIWPPTSPRTGQRKACPNSWTPSRNSRSTV
ncbi:XRE family transcriptional regulator [Streptomyces fagopyri]|uniref:XRE family transcriptional regulator n=1 Tax=Streptomyces fagopyri TaxID=2662397 RepID=UPI0036A3C7F8